MSLLIATDI